MGLPMVARIAIPTRWTLERREKVPKLINKIRNAQFARGTDLPTGWTFKATSKSIRACRPQGTTGKHGILLKSTALQATGFLSQIVACKPEEFYRVEATATCELSRPTSDPHDADCGLILTIQPLKNKREIGEPWVTPPLTRCDDPLSIRAYFEVPENIRQVRVSVGIVRARGLARIEEVRFIPIIEPEAQSHAIAIPAPPTALCPPLTTNRVMVCSETATDRPLTKLLGLRFGEDNVEAISPTNFRSANCHTDAVFFPDAAPPASIRSLQGLLQLAKKRIVLVSLPALAKLAKGQVSLRRIEQDDDPIHAKIAWANYATRGFALADVVPFAWGGQAMGSFVQNHFRKTPALKAFCKQYGFETLLSSVCDQEVTTGRPVCLFKETDGGALFVVDIEPVEAAGSSFGETSLAMYLILNLLGQTQNGLGQYVAPFRKESEFRTMIRDMPDRFAPIFVHDEDVPADEVTDQLVTVGHEDETFGLPIAPKPVIVVRSGLNSGDTDSVYGALFWLKQFVRMAPHPCPYVDALSARYRLAWVPLASSWEPGDGWQRKNRPPTSELQISSQDAKLEAMIDLAAGSTNSIGLVLPSHDGPYRRFIDWLPRLLEHFPPGDHFAYETGPDEGYDDRSRYAWEIQQPIINVIVDPEAFRSRAHRDVLEGGGQVIRIEIPSNDRDATAHSIRRTDIAATCLEQVIGLIYGLIAVNRRLEPVHFGGFPPVMPGETLVVEQHDLLLRENASQAV